MFLCAYCLFFLILFYLLFCVCVCVCVWGGGGGVVTKRKIRILIWTQKIHDFPEVPFQCILNDYSFLLDISMKINLHVWFYFIVFLTILYIT